MLLTYQVLEVISTQSNVLKKLNYDSQQQLLKFLDFITHLLGIRYGLQNLPISILIFTNYSIITRHLLMTYVAISHKHIASTSPVYSLNLLKKLYTVVFNFCDSFHPYVTHPDALIKVNCGQIKCVAFIRASKYVTLFKIFS